MILATNILRWFLFRSLRFGKDVFAVARAAAKSFIRLNNEGRKIRKQQPVRQQQQHKAHLLLRQKLPQEEVHPKAIVSQRGKLKLKKLYLTSSTQSFFRSLHGAPISMMQVKTDDEKDTSAPKKEEKDDAEKAPKVLYYDSRNFGSASDWIATMTKYNKA